MPDKIVNHFVLADGSVARYDYEGLENAPDVYKIGWTMADVLPSPYDYVEYDTVAQTLKIPRDFTFYAYGTRYSIQSETVIDVSYATHSSSTHIVQYVVSTGQFEVKMYSAFSPDDDHILICIIRGWGAGNNISNLSINCPYIQDGYLYGVDISKDANKEHLQAIRDEMDEKQDEIETGLYIADDIIQGTYNTSGTTISNATRVRTNGFIEVKANDVMTLEVGTNASNILYSFFNSEKVFQYDSAWYSENKTVQFGANGFVILLFKNAGDANISPADYDALVTLERYTGVLGLSEKANPSYASTFEYNGNMYFNGRNFIGGNMSSGVIDWRDTQKTAAVSPNMFEFDFPVTINANDGYKFGAHLFDDNGNFISDPGWQTSYNMPAHQKFKLIVTNWPRDFQHKIDDATAQEWAENINITTAFKKDIDRAINPSAGAYEYFGEKITLNRNTYNCSFLFNTNVPSSITTGWQGSTVYDGKLFRLANTGMCAIYEIWNGTALASFDLGSKSSDNHANSCSFGAEKYSESSAFPMLYVTAGSGTQIKLVVEDIHSDGNGGYTSTQVQEITYDKSSLAAAGFIDGWGWPCWVVDAEKGYLYTIGTIRQSSSSPNTSSDNTNKMVFNKFKIPDKSVASVTFTAADLLEQWTTPFEPMLTQGACYYNGYIFAVYGLGSNYQNAVCVYDTVQRAMVARLDCTLNQDPLYNKEPEDCAVYNNKLIVTTSGNDVYNIEFM